MKLLFIISLISIISLNILLRENTLLPIGILDELNELTYEIHSIDIKDTYYEDLEFLSGILVNNKVLLLGEQLHTDGSTFQAKSRLIRYLHEKLNYNVVLYEANLYDMWYMQKCLREDSLLYETESLPHLGLYDFWWDNEECKPLWDYYFSQVINNELYLGGFDIRLTGKIDSETRYAELKEYLASKNIHLDNYKTFSYNKNNWHKYEIEWYNKNLSPGLKDSLLDDLEALTSTLNVSRHTYADNIYYRYLTGMKERFKSAWQFPAGSIERMQVRDSLMAENLIWLIDSVFTDKKIIVWTSNLHLFYNQDEAGKESISFKTMGQYIKEKYSSSSYMCAFTSYGTKNKAGIEIRNTASNKSMEYIFHNLQKRFLFLDLTQVPKNSFFDKEFVSVMNQGIHIRSGWKEKVDGIFYIDTIKSIANREGI